MGLYNDFKTGKSPGFVVIVILIFGIALLFLPQLFTHFSMLPLSYEQTGEIGDIVSGITMPFISFAGIILTFLAFWIQYKANLELRRDIEIDRFASRYYELLKLHKENVNEMNLDDVYKGREIFRPLFDELRFTYFLIENIVNDFKPDSSKSGRFDNLAFKIAYRIFYFGYNENSLDELKTFLDNSCQPNDNVKILARLKQEKNKFTSAQTSSRPLRSSVIINKETIWFTFSHAPFQGQVSRLGHYYRHLFLTVTYIDGFSATQMNDSQKYDYTKTIRGQLSVYEQLLLYYNALSDYGSPWLADKHPYLIRYRLIKNMPLDLSDFGVDPKVKFEKEIIEHKTREKKFFEMISV